VPEIPKERRQQGGWAQPRVDVDEDRDWSIPGANVTELAVRRLPTPDQSRYGPSGTTSSPRHTADGAPRR
jgi:hypothetical protein